jgi:hypothetical protein
VAITEQIINYRLGGKDISVDQGNDEAKVWNTVKYLIPGHKWWWQVANIVLLFVTKIVVCNYVTMPQIKRPICEQRIISDS